MSESSPGTTTQETSTTQYEPTEEEVRNAIERLKKQKDSRIEYQKKRNELLKSDPDAAEKAKKSRQEYNQSEKAKARRKAYYEANKATIFEAHKRYHAKQRAILKKAKELGLLDDKKTA